MYIANKIKQGMVPCNSDVPMPFFAQLLATECFFSVPKFNNIQVIMDFMRCMIIHYICIVCVASSVDKS